MKNKSLLGIVLLAVILCFSLNCSPEGTSKVTITIDLGILNEGASYTPENSIIERIFHFFAKTAKAQTAPVGITSIGLTVTGEGMTTLYKTYTADTSTITLDVPAGTARVFQVTAYRPTGDYGGSSAPHDLEAGQSVEIPITMAAQTASVTINPAYPNGSPASTSLTYFVNITTSGQVVLSSSFTPGNALQVPAGASKDIEVLVNTPSVTFRGTFSTNLAANGSVTIIQDMALYETKIIIPDYYNQRIVQIDDMSGTNWSTRVNSNIGYTGFILYPQDIDFDSQGRIFIANDTPESAGAYQILIIDDITSTTSTKIIPSNLNGMNAMVIDRNNSYIYYVQGTTLYRTNLDGTGSSSISLSVSIGLIRGMTVDNSGLLYIVGNNASGNPGVFVYDYTIPGIANSVTNATITSLSTPYHVLIKSPYLYVVNPSTSGSNNQLLQLNMSTLQFIQGYGSYSLVSTAQGNFYGPRRFIAVLNRKISLIDEGPDGTVTSKLISMDDISGTNWETYGTCCSGTNQFNFYFYC